MSGKRKPGRKSKTVAPNARAHAPTPIVPPVPLLKHSTFYHPPHQPECSNISERLVPAEFFDSQRPPKRARTDDSPVDGETPNVGKKGKVTRDQVRSFLFCS